MTKGPHIAVIGLVGKSMFFDVPRFHSGGETIHAIGFHEEWGGKGFNQAIAAARQDASVSFLGAVSSSDVKPLKEFCSKEGVRAVLAAKKNATASAAILTDGTGETRVTVYAGAELAPKDVDGFAEAIATADILLLNNEVPLELVSRVFLFTPNEFEERELGEVPCEVVTTLGAKGCRIRSTGEVIPAPRVQAVDSTGAGDTFTAVLAVRLAEGAPLHDACAAACAAAAESVAVRHVMPSIPRCH